MLRKTVRTVGSPVIGEATESSKSRETRPGNVREYVSARSVPYETPKTPTLRNPSALRTASISITLSAVR